LLFVFSGPGSGNDIVQDFRRAKGGRDHIGLKGHVGSFNALTIEDDGNGDAVAVLAAGDSAPVDSITLIGVTTASLMESTSRSGSRLDRQGGADPDFARYGLRPTAGAAWGRDPRSGGFDGRAVRPTGVPSLPLPPAQ